MTSKNPPWWKDSPQGLEPWKNLKVQDFRNLKMLFELCEENEEDLADPPCMDTTSIYGSQLLTYYIRTSQIIFQFLASTVALTCLLERCFWTYKMDIIGNLDCSNLNFQQRAAIKELKSLTQVVIKSADKGGKAVLLNTEDYLWMCYDILSNTSRYRHIKLKTIDSFKTEFLSITNRLKTDQVIAKATWEFLNIQFPLTLTFYAFTKVRKNL